MLVEKLLLHVLIILMPIFIYNFFFAKKRFGKSPYFCGMLQGISVTLCLLFSFEAYGLYWDLRYVPLVLASLYGGPVASVIVLCAYFGVRTYIGGDALPIGYLSGILAVMVPFLYSFKFMSYPAKKRIRMAVLVGVWPMLVMLAMLGTHLVITGDESAVNYDIIKNVLIFGAIQVVSIWIASRINESMIENELMKQEIARAEKLNTLGELAASIAHEVRNPLTVVKGFLQLMHKQEKGQNHTYLTLVLSELGRAESIINDYLNFAKPQFEKIEECNLTEILTDISILLEPLANKDGVNLEYSLEEDIYVITDRNQVKQAFINLIKNAIEATNDGGCVSVTLKIENEQAFILIRDTGKGMSEEELSRIGTLFYTTRDKGTGLGTTVSLRIIESMGGQIDYKSEQNVGTEVIVLLPAIQKESSK
ncbi:ATP-binding protein [Bacillus luteolus]|uniref:histidine kinase n=1 Tax=Litchfieldia luteola TaxID=682179 RepID=A0ABR9QQ42_9BACI|nr:ATP-binding protein [Cytobacillus luteolus]MBE4910627.1 ATP-binding protein [Cytobacillus luteolus]MBP1943806.1 two-component system sporulation sensor kinase B [Cytobacillus luteolus]